MKNKPIILFDGVCNLCNTSIQFVLKHEKEAELSFSSLQSDFSQDFIQKKNLQKKYLDTIILLENNSTYIQSRAIIKISKYLKFPFNLLSLLDFLPNLVFRYFFDYLYNLVSANRYKIFGKKDTCYMPQEDFSQRFIT